MSFSTDTLDRYFRAVNYLSVVQIYLKSNTFLRNPLSPEDIKPRLLGHWGTCPGINFVYAHLNRAIIDHDFDSLFVVGPGHGFPAIQANLFIEKTLKRFYPEATHTENGIEYISKKFSWPYGFPSHSNPEAPGVILEGGELGYSLSTSYGSVLDNPDLITVCLIGDGEAETGPAATAWHANKFIDPAVNGAVLPILHLNGYKISGPTIFGRMSDNELRSLFVGYGYIPIIVTVPEQDTPEQSHAAHDAMMEAFDKSIIHIRRIQSLWKKGTPCDPPRFPMIILRSPKGWTGVKNHKGKKISGNYISHQVIVKEAKTDEEDLHALEEWLRSYHFEELFTDDGGFADDIKELIPREERRLGMSKHAYGGEKVCRELELPDPKAYSEDAEIPGTIGSSSMRRIGEYLNDVVIQNEKNRNFRLFSPDETYSNKLDKMFESTKRAFVWPLYEWDEDLGRDGRVIEMLSEHTLQGLMQGYILTGRHAIFASYEAFVQIVASMADQYAKFLSIARLTPWRGDIPSFNYILTSSGWRQEHNGFSHQNPGFIDDMLQRQGCFVNVYFPPDGNTALVTIDHCLKSKNEINIIVCGKTLEPRWLTPEQARAEFKQGLAIWDFASDDDPHVVLSAIGDYLTKETLAAIEIIRGYVKDARLRFVNVLSLTTLGFGHSACRVPLHDFEFYYTDDKPVIFNFHGYPQTLKQILFDYGNTDRFSVHGYQESGSTTTPFDMHVRNETSRFHLAIEVLERLSQLDVIPEDIKQKYVREIEDKLANHKDHIMEYGVDLEEIDQWVWNTHL